MLARNCMRLSLIISLLLILGPTASGWVAAPTHQLTSLVAISVGKSSKAGTIVVYGQD